MEQARKETSQCPKALVVSVRLAQKLILVAHLVVHYKKDHAQDIVHALRIPNLEQKRTGKEKVDEIGTGPDCLAMVLPKGQADLGMENSVGDENVVQPSQMLIVVPHVVRRLSVGARYVFADGFLA